MKAQHHGVAGQLNVLTLDKDSECTGFGEHVRCRVGRDTQGPRYITVTADLHAPGSENLPLPTLAQVAKLARGFFSQPVGENAVSFVDRTEWRSDRGAHVVYDFAVSRISRA